ncbi:MAG TPA: hypothetical protein ENF73_03625, partial [Proteobacteria bacterium]|nr:hypothetical protein [Pseudomonadota bacterium]
MFGDPNMAYDILAVVKPVDPRTGDELELRFADRYVSCDGYAWDGRIVEAGDASEQVEGELRMAPAFGDFAITLTNADGELTEALLDYIWSGAETQVYAIPRGAKTTSEGVRIFGGYIATSGGVEADGDRIT